MLIQINTSYGPVVFRSIENDIGRQKVTPNTSEDEKRIGSLYSIKSHRFDCFYIENGFLFVDFDTLGLYNDFGDKESFYLCPEHEYKVIEE